MRLDVGRHAAQRCAAQCRQRRLDCYETTPPEAVATRILRSANQAPPTGSVCNALPPTWHSHKHPTLYAAPLDGLTLCETHLMVKMAQSHCIIYQPLEGWPT